MWRAPPALRRFTIAQEVLPAMKLIKFYGWEGFIEQRILDIRRLEERLLAKGAALKGLNICLVFTVRPRAPARCSSRRARTSLLLMPCARNVADNADKPQQCASSPARFFDKRVVRSRRRGRRCRRCARG